MIGSLHDKGQEADVEGRSAVQSTVTASKPKTDNSRSRGSIVRQKRSIIKGLLLAAIVTLSVLVFGLFFYDSSTDLSDVDVVNRVADLIDNLPTEDPIMATIEDVDALTQKDQFFADSNNGDRVLVYLNSRRAIIYRPSSNQVIKDGLVSLE